VFGFILIFFYLVMGNECYVVNEGTHAQGKAFSSSVFH